MPMLPADDEQTQSDNEALDEAISSVSPSLTYKLDIQNKRIVGMTDGAAAIVQAAFKIIYTERAAYEIYDDAYGIELDDLIGQNRAYVENVMIERFRGALLADERITAVDEFTIQQTNSNTLNISFLLSTTAGDIPIDGIEVSA